MVGPLQVQILELVLVLEIILINENLVFVSVVRLEPLEMEKVGMV